MKKTRQKICCSCCPKKQKKIYKIETTEELLSLMNIYFTEWSHRDSLMWKQVCTFFFAAFIVTLLPFSKIWEISLTKVIPNFVFPIVGIVLSLIFLYITIQYAHRLSKSSDTCRELIEHLPKEFQRKKLYDIERINFSKKLAYIVPMIMFLTLVIFAVIILVLCLVN